MSWANKQQTWKGDLTGLASPYTCVYTSNVTAGSLLVCSVTTDGVITSVSDNLNGAWTPILTTLAGTAGLAGINGKMFYFPASAAGAITVSLVFTPGTFVYLFIMEFSYTGGSLSLETGSAYKNATANGSAQAFTDILTSVGASDLIIANGFAEDNAGPLVGVNTFTILGTTVGVFNGGGGVQYVNASGNDLGYIINGGPTTYQGQFNESAGAGSAAMVGIVGFKILAPVIAAAQGYGAAVLDDCVWLGGDQE